LIPFRHRSPLLRRNVPGCGTFIEARAPKRERGYEELPVARLGCNKPLNWQTAVLFGAISAVVTLAGPDPARAGMLDFLFSGFHQQPASPAVTSYAEPSAPVRATEGERQGGGRAVVYCVRLCDGQHFPLERAVYATPVETCKAMCPASKTKVFFGNGIDHASARDGQRYTDLDAAYVYRDHLVPNCTCNGKDALGLAPFDAKTDPTLRPGDIVSTKDGLMAYAGKRGGQTAEFTPVDAFTLSADASAKSTRVRLSRRATESTAAADDQPGTIVRPQADLQADLRGQVNR
jgi:Protein of unknown function (DUF2865)